MDIFRGIIQPTIGTKSIAGEWQRKDANMQIKDFRFQNEITSLNFVFYWHLTEHWFLISALSGNLNWLDAQQDNWSIEKGYAQVEFHRENSELPPGTLQGVSRRVKGAGEPL